MQQLKLLNFYKLLSNIATKLVGAFIPLIVLQATGSLALGFFTLIAQYLVRIAFNFAFRKFYERIPQIMLMFRVVSVVTYSFSIILIDTHMWLGIIGVIFFSGLDSSLKTLPIEIIFNYSSSGGQGKGGGLGFSRLMEQVGILVALVVGGILLDVNKTLVIIISVAIYLISVIPLVIYFFKSRKQKTFNQDSISNASLTYDKHPEYNNVAKSITKKLLWFYAITYFIYCFQDMLGTTVNLHVFLSSSSYGSAGYLNAVYNAMYGIGCYVFGIIDNKKETTGLIVMSCAVCALSVLGLVLYNNMIFYYIMMIPAGFFYGFVCTFALQRLLPKSRILGVGNSALFYRENASNSSVIMASCLGLFGSVMPILISIVVTMAISAILIPVNEENTRRLLINYLQNHERAMQDDKPRKRKHIAFNDLPILPIKTRRKRGEK